MTFKRENRYIVIKRKHLDRTKENAIRNFLHENQIPSIDSVVVESDWPEFEKVWNMIEKRMNQCTE
ncbi:hypothetical protein [Aliikangiella sp. IMCC44359]|uniref:hypothetical protein n=1 Tax=Aliikangiella sp. IMCC44359 TaxID=3459125 RepID=UPI00403B1841